jgi:hypothetical protein
MMYITLLSAIVSVGGAILVAPGFGAPGVALTTSGAAVLQNLLQLIFARRFVGVWTNAYFSPRRAFRYLFGKDTVRTGKASD